MFVFIGNGDHRDLHVRTHPFPTRRSSDLEGPQGEHGCSGSYQRCDSQPHAEASRQATPRFGEALTGGRTRPIVELMRGCLPGQSTSHTAPERSRSWSSPGPRWATASASCASTRSEEHTSELQSLMRSSYAVFCLKKNKTQ